MISTKYYNISKFLFRILISRINYAIINTSSIYDIIFYPDLKGVTTMKKLAAVTSALLTASAAMPYIPQAAEEITAKNTPHADYLNIITTEQDIMQAVSDRGLDFDFNSDGKFDHLDCYLLDRYIDTDYCNDQFMHYEHYIQPNDNLPEEIRSKIAANADIDGDSIIDAPDKIRVLRHFLLNCDIDTSIFETSTYADYDDELGIPHGTSSGLNNCIRSFISSLNSDSIFIGVNYLFLREKINAGEIDIDVNNDRKFDIADVLDFEIATTSEPWISEQDPVTGYWSYISSPDKKIDLDEDVVTRARKITMEPEEFGYKSLNEYDVAALLDYLFETEPVLPEYLDNTYYEKFHEGARFYEFGSYVEDYLEYTGQTDTPKLTLTETAEQTQDSFEKEQQYIEDVESGKIAPPDLNFDGIIDGRDFHVAELFHGARVFGRTQEESQLTVEEYDNLAANCDCNQNGISGDDNDIFIIHSYICKAVTERTRAMATDENGEYYESYVNALYAKEMSPDENPYPNDLYHLYDNSGIEFEFPSPEEHLDSYTTRVAMRIMSAPDIDGNGTVDELDKKYADSYAAFLETGTMIDEIPEDVIERIKTSCDFTDDGNSGLLYDMKVASLYISKYILHTEDETVPSEKSESADIVLTEKCPGDANCDTAMDMSDAVLIMQSLSNPTKYGISGSNENHITEQGKKNADIVGNDDGVTNSDALAIQKKLLGFDSDTTT